ncbi:MAG: hypothetical protein L0H93_16570 [Nocardioides sp.]|nr:hypothetical protein [Nocardioides sp.]
MSVAAKVSATVAAVLLAWLVLVIVTAFGGLVGIVELAIVACILIAVLYYIWKR